MFTSVALAACNRADLDQDGDGFTKLTNDCDDTDPNVHPDAPEVCYNGKDDNCNGVEDEEGATSGRVWYADLDGDGYGDNGITVLACEQPENYAPNKWDCNESDPTINPGAPELCDYIDNDCDGEVDEDTSEDALTWYPDRDGDGYGDEESVVYSCEAPPDHVAEGGDCDDLDPGINPGRTEVCTTPLDEDCDGSINDPDAYGCTDFYADLDGDGFAGTLGCLCEAEAPYIETEATDCDDTRADVFPGAEGTSRFAPEDCDGERVVDISEPDVRIESGLRASSWLSHRVIVDDLDGDGQQGMLALAVNNRSAWMDGPLETRASFDEARIWFPSPERGAYGFFMAVIDDLDADGIRDFAWGWRADDPGDEGLYFFSGAATGDLSVDDAIGMVPMSLTTRSRTYVGRSMVAGDFTGDGATEVYVQDGDGVPTLVRPGLGAAGSRVQLAVPNTGGQIGGTARVQDVNVDGQPDLVLSGHGSRLESGFMWPRRGVDVSGAVFVYEGPLSEGSRPDHWVYGTSGSTGNPQYGDFLWHDVDEDGAPDLLVSQYWESFVAFRSGLLWAVYGPFEHTMVEDDWPSIMDGEPWLSGVEEYDKLMFIHPLDDLTGDGRTDLLVIGDDGASYLIDRFLPGHGRADQRGRRIEGGRIWTAASVADLNGDGAAELAASVLGDGGFHVDLFLGDAP